MLSVNEDGLFDEINLLRHEWLKEINIKKQDIIDGRCCSSPYRIELAHKIYVSGQKAEMRGYLQIAVEQYRRATCLVHDIERTMKPIDIQCRLAIISDQNDATDLTCIENKCNDPRGREAEDCGQKIFQLPDEVLLHIMKWVVGASLDIYSLLLQGLVCSKFFALSRDEQLWRLICLRLWPECSYLDLPYFGGSWISMVKSRPHLLFHGCYLGSTSYVRKGEPTVNTVSTPFLLVRYFRVFRFRCDGSVEMVTSAQDPQDIIRIMSAIDHNGCLTQLPHSNMNYSIAFGHYSVVDSMVFVNLVRSVDSSLATATKFGRSKKVLLEVTDKHYLDMIFQIKPSKKRPNHLLRWKSFSLRNDVSVTHFDIRRDKYPTLVFSRVREFCGTLSHEHL